MSTRALDTITGRAIDDETTKNCHQIFSITQQDDLNTLHYSVFRPSGKLQVDKKFMDNVCDVLTDTRGLLTEAGRQHANTLFGQLMSKIKTDKKSHFLLNFPSPAITFDIGFNNSFEVQNIDFRLTTATMTEKLGCNYARNNVVSDNPDPEIKVWHDFIVHQKYEQSIDRALFFEEVTNNTTAIIQQYMCDYSVRNHLGGIFKIVPEAILIDDEYVYSKCSYGSTLNFYEQIEMLGIGNYITVLPSTANRQAIDSLNLASLATFKETGKNLYTPDFLSAVANYKMVRQKYAA
jgi:hypothetical protein